MVYQSIPTIKKSLKL